MLIKKTVRIAMSATQLLLDSKIKGKIGRRGFPDKISILTARMACDCDRPNAKAEHDRFQQNRKLK